MPELMGLFISTLFVNNFVFAKMLGLCPFLGVTKKIDNAMGMGLAVIFVITLASIAGWTLDRYLLVPLGVTYLRTIVFILSIAVLVQFVEMAIQKTSPPLYQALGIYIPLITTNCVVLGVVILIANRGFGLLQMLVYAIGAPVGFYIALFMLANINEQLALAKVPRPFRGAAISLVTCGILALAFMGFSGLVRE
ncbi:MAG TPA: electron transport complex subunit RsxA [Nitrospiria bacterium]|nr:electron transport complex subunit RsxA [Nitrospiria bacterium]